MKKVFLTTMIFIISMCGSLSFARVDEAGSGEKPALTLDEERQVVKEALKDAFGNEIKQYPLLGAFLELKVDVIFDRVIKILKKRGVDIKVSTVRAWIVQNKQNMMRKEGILAFMDQKEEQQQSFLDQQREERQREERRPTAEEMPAQKGQPCNPNIPNYSQPGCVPQD
ncbi:MAG: hypothetical protein HYY61_03740 [Deltaproteobacteria bacterium]|nr:hypothetical protein [Deltaproteobacteria bacterium]